MGLLNKNKNQQEQTGQTTNVPWEQAQPYIQDIMAQAQGTYNTQSGQSNPNLYIANGMIGDALSGRGTAGNQFTSTINGDYLGGNNQYLDTLYQNGANDITNRLKTLYEGVGRYGSNVFNQDIASNLGNLYASLYAPAYENERNRQLQAAGALSTNQYNAATLLPTLNNIPWQNLNNYAGAVGSAIGGTGTTTTYEPKPSAATGLLGGALSGLQIGSAIGHPLIGTALGGLLGLSA